MRYRKLILFMATLCILLCGCSIDESKEPKESTEKGDGKEVQEVYLDPYVLENLPTFTFTSGAGGWMTHLDINSDGTFTGNYKDSDMGYIGDEYPNGTEYFCNFSGKFSVVEAVDEYTYHLHLDSIKLENEEGLEWIENGVRYITTGPYGMEDSTDFMLYLPGKPIDELSEEYLSWVGISFKDEDVMPRYGLYNVDGEKGFYSKPQE